MSEFSAAEANKNWPSSRRTASGQSNGDNFIIRCMMGS